MDYRVLNKIQRDRMKQISVHTYDMEWENPEFMNYLMGELPRIRKFVFIVDAINEMSEEGQHKLLSILEELKEYHRIRTVISYRTNSMDNNILKKYQGKR